MRSAALFAVGVLLALALRSASGLYSSSDDVVLATDATFKQLVLDSPKISVVEFFAPWCGHCKNLAPEYKKAATNLKGMINVVAVDCDSPTGKALAARYEIRGFPTIKIFSPESSAPEDYQGPRTAAGIAKTALGKLHTKYIKKIAAKNIDEIEKAELPKAILFTKKTTTADLFKAISFEFKDRLIVGEVHESEKAIADKYGVTDYPTLIVVKHDEAKTEVTYDGPIKYDSIARFLEQYALPPKQRSGGSSSQSPKTGPKPPPPATLVQVTNQAEFKKECLDYNNLCVLAFLPPKEDDGSAHAAYLNALEEVVKKHGKTFRFVWMDGLAHEGFRKRFEVSTELPAFLVLSPPKLRYSPFVGAPTAAALGDFLDKVLRGSRATIPLDKMPEMSA